MKNHRISFSIYPYFLFSIFIICPFIGCESKVDNKEKILNQRASLDSPSDNATYNYSSVKFSYSGSRKISEIRLDDKIIDIKNGDNLERFSYNSYGTGSFSDNTSHTLTLILQNEGEISRKISNNFSFKYSCPEEDIINCTGKENDKKECQGEYHRWIEKECPNTKIDSHLSIISPVDKDIITYSAIPFIYTASEGQIEVKLDGKVIAINSGDNLEMYSFTQNGGSSFTDGTSHTISVTLRDDMNNFITRTSTFSLKFSCPSNGTMDCINRNTNQKECLGEYYFWTQNNCNSNRPNISITSPVNGKVYGCSILKINYTQSEGQVEIKLDNNIIDIKNDENLEIFSNRSFFNGTTHTIEAVITDSKNETASSSSTFSFNYSCPSGEVENWINCMPSPFSLKCECSGAFHNWIEENCPNIQFAY